MKRFDIVKTIELVIFICLAGVGLFLIFTDDRLYQLIATDPQIRILCVLLWLSLVLIFLVIFLDFSLFSTFKREYKELSFAVFSDQVAGIANRYSCDAVIEKYLDKPLPDHVGCIMFDLTNIKEINKLYGHLQGNSLIRDFSVILQFSSRDLCFVGRNGGNKFLAIFEDCTWERISKFLEIVSLRVQQHNGTDGAHPIAYKYGIAFQVDKKAASITELISLSNQSIYQEDKNQ